MPYGETLFRLGIGIMCAAGGIAVLSLALFTVTGKHLKKTLEREYGKKRSV